MGRLFGRLMQLPALVPALLALHALPVHVLVVQDLDVGGRDRGCRSGDGKADRVNPLAGMVGPVVDVAEDDVLVGQPARLEARKDVRPAHPHGGSGRGVRKCGEGRALAPGGGEDLVGVEGEDQPPPGEAARRLEQQPLPRALVVPGPGVVDERDLGVAGRDLARPVGRALVRDDDVIGPQARAAEEAVEDPGLVADRRDDDRGHRGPICGRTTSARYAPHQRGNAAPGAAVAVVRIAAPLRSHTPGRAGALETARPSGRSPAEPPADRRVPSIARTAFAPGRRACRGLRSTGCRGADAGRGAALCGGSGSPVRREGTGSYLRRVGRTPRPSRASGSRPSAGSPPGRAQWPPGRTPRRMGCQARPGRVSLASDRREPSAASKAPHPTRPGALDDRRACTRSGPSRYQDAGRGTRS